MRPQVISRRRWALFVRRGIMMPQPIARPNRQSCDTLRLRTTSRGRLLANFAGWSGYPSIAALSINPEIDVMCQCTKSPRDSELKRAVR